MRIATETNIQNLSAELTWFIRKQHTLSYSTKCNYNKLYCVFTPVYTSTASNTYYLIGDIYKFYHGDEFLPQKFELKSWKEAAELCNSVGAHLPVLGSRNDLHEFISLLRYSNHIPPLEAVYIGLKYKTRSQGLMAHLIYLICEAEVRGRSVRPWESEHSLSRPHRSASHGLTDRTLKSVRPCSDSHGLSLESHVICEAMLGLPRPPKFGLTRPPTWASHMASHMASHLGLSCGLSLGLSHSLPIRPPTWASHMASHMASHLGLSHSVLHGERPCERPK